MVGIVLNLRPFRGELGSELAFRGPPPRATVIMASCPKGLTGTEWLVAQGARSEVLRYRGGILNPELSSNLMGWGMRTELPVQEDDAADWQVAYGEHRRENLQAASVDPGRMVQYVAGRPCVAPG